MQSSRKIKRHAHKGCAQTGVFLLFVFLRLWVRALSHRITLSFIVETCWVQLTICSSMKASPSSSPGEEAAATAAAAAAAVSAAACASRFAPLVSSAARLRLSSRSISFNEKSPLLLLLMLLSLSPDNEVCHRGLEVCHRGLENEEGGGANAVTRRDAKRHDAKRHEAFMFPSKRDPRFE